MMTRREQVESFAKQYPSVWHSDPIVHNLGHAYIGGDFSTWQECLEKIVATLSEAVKKYMNALAILDAKSR